MRTAPTPPAKRWSRRGVGVISVALWLVVAGVGRAQIADALVSDGGGAIPDTDGAIAELTLHYDPELHQELDSLYHDLFIAVPSDVRIRILCPSKQDVKAFTRSWGPIAMAGRREVACVIVGRPISPWARDRCIARQTPDLLHRKPSFVPRRGPAYGELKTNDLDLQKLLHRAKLAPPVLESWLHVEGGNVVSNRRHAFVGANVVDENGGQPNSDRLESELQRILGRQHLLIGGDEGSVPWCHVDMYLTPLDDRTVLVASTEVGCNLLCAGGHSHESIFGTDGLSADACSSGCDHQSFDLVANQARNHGYRVHRLPALADHQREWMVTYNNVLLDRRDWQRVVYLPAYGIPRLDRAAEAMYRALGWEVRPIDVSRIYRLGGALRCVANVTERRPADCTSTRKLRHQRAGLRYIDLARAGRERVERATVGGASGWSATRPRTTR
jgi:hypothetical protein